MKRILLTLTVALSLCGCGRPGMVLGGIAAALVVGAASQEGEGTATFNSPQPGFDVRHCHLNEPCR